MNALLCCTCTSQTHTMHSRVKVEEVGDIDIGLDLQGNTNTNNTGEKVCGGEREGGRERGREGGREGGRGVFPLVCFNL